MLLQIIFLSIPGWLFVLVSWLATIELFLLFLLYKENKRWKFLTDLSRWGYKAVLEAAERAYTKVNLSASQRWEMFLKDIQSITNTVKNEKQGKKPTS